MGCGVFKRQLNAGIDLRLRESGDPRLDAVVKELAEPLYLLSSSRKQLKAALKALQKEVGVYKQLKNPTFFDFLMAMLFCLSASGEGDLENIGFELSNEAPFIQVNEDLLYVEHRGIMMAWRTLMHLVERLPQQLEPMRDQIQAALAEMARCGVVENPVESDPVTALESQASPLVMRTTSVNHGKLSLAPGLLDAILSEIQEILDTVHRLPHILSEASHAIKAVGQRAYVELCINPRDIVAKYWPTSKSII